MTTLPPITNRQQDILRLIYEYRFLSRPQIQTFLKLKDKAQTIRWLKDLRIKHYIQGIYSQKRELRNDPAIYYSGLGAIRFFKTQTGTSDQLIQALYQDRTRSKNFIDTRLLIADLALKLDHHQDQDTRFIFATKAAYSNPASRGHWLSTSTISPDAVVIKNKQGHFSNATVQVFPARVPTYTIYSTISRYLDLYYQSLWEEHMGLPFPNIIFVFTTKWAKDEAIKYLHKRGGETKDITFHLLTQYQIKTKGIAPYIDQEKTARD